MQAELSLFPKGNAIVVTTSDVVLRRSELFPLKGIICGDLSIKAGNIDALRSRVYNDDFRQLEGTVYQDIKQRRPNVYTTEVMITEDKFFYVFVNDQARAFDIQQ